jgi:hypothetical protein
LAVKVVEGFFLPAEFFLCDGEHPFRACLGFLCYSKVGQFGAGQPSFKGMLIPRHSRRRLPLYVRRFGRGEKFKSLRCFDGNMQTDMEMAWGP